MPQRAEGGLEETPTPGSAWVACGAVGLPPLALPAQKGRGLGALQPTPTAPPEPVVIRVCSSRGSAEQLSSAYSVALGSTALPVLVRVVFPPDPAALCELLSTTRVRNHGL